MPKVNLTSAKVIADSISPMGFRCLTYILVMPRIILAEFNTHRMISRNSASSRAIPFKKMLETVMKTPFIPMKFMKEHKGMQGTQYFEKKWQIWILTQLWLTARNMAVIVAWMLNKFGFTKQLCNRLLEPFMYHTVIATATEWENFFALRAHKDAEIHMQDLAYKMLDACNQSTPKQLQPGQWHIPFLMENEPVIWSYLKDQVDKGISQPQFATTYWEAAVKVATARCARVSFTIVGEGNKIPNAAKDVELHDRLRISGHMSPFEHIARAMTKEEYESWGKFEGWNQTYYENHSLGWCGNLRGFVQYRKLISGENKSDTRMYNKSNKGLHTPY